MEMETYCFGGKYGRKKSLGKAPQFYYLSQVKSDKFIKQ